jgi:hypothetical protein
VLLSEADFRRFFQLADDEYTDIVLRVRNPSEVAKVAQKAGIALRQHRVITRDDVRRTYEAVFSWREGLLLALLSGAVLAFAILAFDKASGLSAQERRDIGILKAIGWDTGDILRMKLWEATLIAGTACAAGVLLAYAHVFVFSAPLIEPVLKGWSTLYPRFVLTPTSTACNWPRWRCCACCPTWRRWWCRCGAPPPPTPTRPCAEEHAAMIELTQVSKRFHEGQPNEVVAVRDVSLRLQPGCGHRAAGPQRLGQDHAADADRLPGAAHRGPRAAAGPAAVGPARAAPGAGAAADLRLCLPALQPHPGPEHAAQRDAAGLPAGPAACRAGGPGPRVMAELGLATREATRWNCCPAARCSARPSPAR